MLLLNALIPSSKLNDSTWNEPEKHGGFELGTWTFGSYLDYIQYVTGNDIGKNYQKTKKGGKYYLFGTINREDCAKILADIKLAKPIRKNGNVGSMIGRNFAGYNKTVMAKYGPKGTNPNSYSAETRVIKLSNLGYKMFKDLFSNESVIFYGA